jgi:sodium/bile acid cotransporter 7
MLPLMIFHQIQLVVCALIASRLAREADAEGASDSDSRALPEPPETSGPSSG